MQSTWRDTANKPKGMRQFSRWRVSTKQMQDIDGLCHNKDNNHFVMVELKPAGTQLTVGQEISLAGFSKLPGCIGLCIFDYDYLDESDDLMDQDQEYRVIWFTEGKQDKGWQTLRDINIEINIALGL